MSKVQIQKDSLYNWDGYRLTAGHLALFVIPQVGGRIISLRDEEEELFFVQEEYRGDVYDLAPIDDLRAKKQAFGFRLWGGDKTWVAPQSQWWEKIPPLDLDAGGYDTRCDDQSITMTSPLCRETGLRIIRRVTLQEDGSLFLDQTLRNESQKPITRGIWNVTQMGRPVEIYMIATNRSIRAIKDEGLKEDAKDKKEQSGDWVRINCNDQTHFKFGGKIKEGIVITIKRSENHAIAFSKEFEIDAKADYAHNAFVEIYNSSKYEYCEAEVHAPISELNPDQESSHRQIWKITRHKKDITPDEVLSSFSHL